jgi:hypothetical protein
VPFPVDPEKIHPPPGVGEGSELLCHDQHVVGDRIDARTQEALQV